MGIDFTGLPDPIQGAALESALTPGSDLSRMILWAGWYFEALLAPASFPFFASSFAGVPSVDWTQPQREADLVQGMLVGLPSFERAELSEIVDLRTELNAPLQRFRAAMAEAAKRTEEASAESREHLGKDLWRREVQPALAEIDERIEENRYLRQLANRADPKELAVGAAGLALAFSQLHGVTQAVTASAVAASPLILAARDHWLAQVKIARESRFFFLHKLQRLPSTGSRKYRRAVARRDRR